VGSLLHWDDRLVFFGSALGIVPLAWVLGKATEELAARTGPRVGGLLNATLGNAAELIITIFAIREGLLELVKASIIGSILGNLLLVLGLSVLLGGLRNRTQCFDRSEAGLNATMMVLALIALIIPSIFGHAIEVENLAAVEWLSLGVALVMIVIYVLSLVFSFISVSGETPSQGHAKASWSLRRSAMVLPCRSSLRGVAERDSGVNGGAGGGVAGYHRVLPGSDPHPAGGQCGGASRCRSGSIEEQHEP
jgi:Ca2+:H+ antiporter